MSYIGDQRKERNNNSVIAIGRFSNVCTESLLTLHVLKRKETGILLQTINHISLSHLRNMFNFYKRVTLSPISPYRSGRACEEGILSATPAQISRIYEQLSKFGSVARVSFKTKTKLVTTVAGNSRDTVARSRAVI